MLLYQKDPKGFTVQTSKSEFKTSMKNEEPSGISLEKKE